MKKLIEDLDYTGNRRKNTQWCVFARPQPWSKGQRDKNKNGGLARDMVKYNLEYWARCRAGPASQQNKINKSQPEVEEKKQQAEAASYKPKRQAASAKRQASRQA